MAESTGDAGAGSGRAIRKGDLVVGRPVPYSIYDTYDRLLIRRGYVLRSESQRQLLLEVGRTDPKETPAEPTSPPAQEERHRPGGRSESRFVEPPNPFDVYRHCAQALRQAFRQIDHDPAGFRSRLERLIARLGNLIDHDADATLGAAHLEAELSTPITHPIRTAIVCDVAARRIGLSGPRRRGLVGAALTANVGMLELQAALDQQAEPLTAEQRAQVERHPADSGTILERNGITDESWLQAVYQHHERVDGSGYPHGLTGEQICDEAAVLMIADSYLAMVGVRAHREARDLRSALSELFQSEGRLYPAEHANALIKEMGVFPPGTPVTLSNGEHAVVTRRGPTTTQPQVCVYATAPGRHRSRPRHRDLSEEAVQITSVHAITEARLPFSAEIVWGYGQDSGSLVF